MACVNRFFDAANRVFRMKIMNICAIYWDI
jgi:hypothetical protein